MELVVVTPTYDFKEDLIVDLRPGKPLFVRVVSWSYMRLPFRGKR